MDFLNSFWNNLLDSILLAPRLLYEGFAEGTLATFDALPASNIDTQATLNGVGGDILYFLNMVEFNYGLSVVFGAYIARFLLRRIPLIG